MLRHLLRPQWWTLRAFPKAARGAIEQAIAASESLHRAELRFVVEAALPIGSLLRDQSSRQRAIELFARLGVWDTQDNSGVLIYVQLLDRRVEIVADRGINAKVGEAFWNAVCRRMEAEFAAGRFASGALVALKEITAALVANFPAADANPDELANAPLIL
jgi:uncharacterized membrane protein